jgi:hypothetical protein
MHRNGHVVVPWLLKALDPSKQARQRGLLLVSKRHGELDREWTCEYMVGEINLSLPDALRRIQPKRYLESRTHLEVNTELNQVADSTKISRNSYTHTLFGLNLAAGRHLQKAGGF